MKVTALIVTYGERFHFLKKVLDSLVREKVDDVVIVINGSTPSLLKKMDSLSCLDLKIHKVHIKENSGSANGYKTGLLKAQELKSEYIWLLDDDNEPQPQALAILKKKWNSKSESVVSLLSYRPVREQYKKAIQYSEPNRVLGFQNSFYGFHLFWYFIKFFKKYNPKKVTYGTVACAPYGGMFFHRSLLNIIGLPDKDFFIYSDDHDWSYRITKQGYKIGLVLESVVKDVDKTWHVKETSNKQNVFRVLKNAPPFRLYYNVRNRVVFEKRHLVTHSWIYRINRSLFTFVFYLFAGKDKSFIVFMRALKDAKNNNLGKTYENTAN